jgi:hypothetical protein
VGSLVTLDMMIGVPEAPRITRIEDLPAISVAGVSWRPVRREAALGHLRQAAAIDADKVRRWATDDRNLDSLRDSTDFPA